MNDQKLIKKIFNLALYDFSNNFTNWLSITGLQAILLTIIFCGSCFIISDYTVIHWSWPLHIVADFLRKFFDLWQFACNYMYSLNLVDIYNFYFLMMSLVINILMCMAGIVVFSMVVIQNALDLAFDSSMRGFSMVGSIFAYIGRAMLSNIMLCGAFLFCYFVSMVWALMHSTMHWNIVVLIQFIFIVVMNCSFLYWMQFHYLLSMHIIEYKKGFLQSYTELLHMSSGNYIFLLKILLLQILTIVAVLGLLHVCLGLVISIILPIIIWFFNVLRLDAQPVLIQMLYNFFYLWAYMLLYAWICLVLAHVYRQLVCPPVDNIACSSCQSCEK